MTCFVDASHGTDKITRRSHTGYIIFANNAPISRFSKRQNTVETSTFGAELVALRIATEKVRDLRIKLQLFGIPIEGPTYVLCNNESVMKSTSNVEATLSKKHQVICWHAVREAAAGGWIRIGQEPTETNTADIFTNNLDNERRRRILRMIFPRYQSDDDKG